MRISLKWDGILFYIEKRWSDLRKYLKTNITRALSANNTILKLSSFLCKRSYTQAQISSVQSFAQKCVYTNQKPTIRPISVHGWNFFQKEKSHISQSDIYINSALTRTYSAQKLDLEFKKLIGCYFVCKCLKQ